MPDKEKTPLEERARELIPQLVPGKETIEELDQAERYAVANALIDEGYPVNAIAKLFHISIRKLSRNPPAQPAQGPEAEVQVSPPRKTVSTVKKTIEAVITEKAKAETERIIDVGKRVMEFLGERAERYGYSDVYEFVVDLYNFWDAYRDRVMQLEEENRLYAAALDRLLKLSDRQLVEAFKAMKELQILEARAYATILARLIKQLDAEAASPGVIA